MIGGVYAIQGLPGWVKIGKAGDIGRRMRELQIGQPVPLELLAVLSPDQNEEPAIHARWQHLRAAGEWFRIDDELAAAIDAARSATPMPVTAPPRPRAPRAVRVAGMPLEPDDPSEPSARARKLAAKHPTWSLSRIGEACGLTRQGVAKALQATGKRGRPKGVAGKRKVKP